MRRFLAVILIALLAVCGADAARVQVNDVPAIISDLVVTLTSIFEPSAAQVIDAAGDAILANATIVVVNPDGDYTLTSTPTIADGTTGKILFITAANGEGNVVTVQDQDTFGGSNLQLLSATRSVTGTTTISLYFDSNDWIEFGSTEFATVTLSDLTASRLVSTDASKNLESSDATAWIAGTADDLTVTDDSDGTVTLSTITLKDLVTTAPITGGTNDIFPGADADITVAITVAKDIVAGNGLTGGENDVLPGADADTTITVGAGDGVIANADEVEVYGLVASDGTPNDAFFLDGSGVPTAAYGLNITDFWSLLKESADAVGTITTYDDDASELSELALRKADNTLASPGLVDDNDVLGVVSFSGYDGSGWHEGARIEGRIDGTPSDGTDMPTELSFWTTPEASATSVQVATLSDIGAAQFQNSTDSTTGFQILDSNGGTPVVNVDTTNERVGIGTDTPLADLDVIGELSGDLLNKNNSYDLAGMILQNATTPPCIFVWNDPATTEPDLSGNGNDATYNNFVTSDQVYKYKVWGLSFFDGGDEYLDVGDDAAFSWDDSGANPFSFCAWIQVSLAVSSQTIIAKYDTQASDREWQFLVTSAEKMQVAFFDEADDKLCTNTTDDALSAGWHFVVHTYDSTGGAGAMSDANSVWYVDGVAVAETQANDADYTGMVAGATDVKIGSRNTGGGQSNFFQGDVGVIWLEDVELTPAQVWSMYINTRGYYNE